MKTKKFLHILFCAVLAAVLLMVGVFTFLRPIFTVRIPVSGMLTMTASGEKNPASAGSEVRIRQIALDGEPVNLTTLASTPGWGLDGELLVAYNVASPVTLTIPVEQVETLTLATVGQRGSGVLKISAPIFDASLDLYENADWTEYNESFDLGSSQFAPLSRPDFLLEFGAIFFAIFAAVSQYKNRTPRS